MNNQQKKILEKIKRRCVELNWQLQDDFYINTSTKMNFICFCKKEFTASARTVLRGETKSCGCTCKTKRLNKDIVNARLINRGIIIEYDEWVWHKNKKKQDLAKSKALIKEGWLVIRVLAFSDIPSKDKVFAVIDDAIKNNKNLKIIKSKKWKDYELL